MHKFNLLNQLLIAGQYHYDRWNCWRTNDMQTDCLACYEGAEKLFTVKTNREVKMCLFTWPGKCTNCSKDCYGKLKDKEYSMDPDETEKFLQRLARLGKEWAEALTKPYKKREAIKFGRSMLHWYGFRFPYGGSLSLVTRWGHAMLTLTAHKKSITFMRYRNVTDVLEYTPSPGTSVAIVPAKDNSCCYVVFPGYPGKTKKFQWDAGKPGHSAAAIQYAGVL